MKRHLTIALFLILSVIFYLPAFAADSDKFAIAKKHYSFGVQQKKLGNLVEARRQFEKSIAVYDSLYQVQYIYGDLLVTIGENEKAIAAFERAHQLNPKYYNSLARLASLYHESGNYTATLDMYEKMYKLKPDNVNLLTSIANIKEFIGDNNGAYNAIRELIDKGEDKYENLMRAARFAYDDKDFPAALSYSERSLEKKPEDTVALQLAGETSRLINNNNKAVSYYRCLADIQPESLNVTLSLEDIYRENADRDNLIWALKRHSELEPKNVEVIGEICEIFFQSGQANEGIEYVKKGIEIAPEDGRFHILMGEHYRSVGQKENALSEFKRALKDEQWATNAQHLIWQFEKPETEEEKIAKDFFTRGKNQQQHSNGGQ